MEHLQMIGELWELGGTLGEGWHDERRNHAGNMKGN